MHENVRRGHVEVSAPTVLFLHLFFENFREHVEQSEEYDDECSWDPESDSEIIEDYGIAIRVKNVA